MRRRAYGAPLALAAALTLAPTPPAQAADPDALWHVVHDLCVPMHRVTRLSAPCLAVDPVRHTAVVPNPRSSTEVLLVPTSRVSGVEDPALQAADAPDYWGDAWAARRWVARRAGKAAIADDDLAMAVNAIAGRSQDQLHIHVDCVRPDVKAALAGAATRLTSRWGSVQLHGGTWRVRRLAGDTPRPDPFRLLADDIPGAAGAMGAWTLVVVGLTAPSTDPGFALLARRTGPGFAGHGEFLLDKRCAVLKGGA